MFPRALGQHVVNRLVKHITLPNVNRWSTESQVLAPPAETISRLSPSSHMEDFSQNLKPRVLTGGCKQRAKDVGLFLFLFEHLGYF